MNSPSLKYFLNPTWSKINLFATRLMVLASTASTLANSSVTGILLPYVSSCKQEKGKGNALSKMILVHKITGSHSQRSQAYFKYNFSSYWKGGWEFNQPMFSTYKQIMQYASLHTKHKYLMTHSNLSANIKPEKRYILDHLALHIINFSNSTWAKGLRFKSCSFLFSIFSSYKVCLELFLPYIKHA